MSNPPESPEPPQKTPPRKPRRVWRRFFTGCLALAVTLVAIGSIVQRPLIRRATLEVLKIGLPGAGLRLVGVDASGSFGRSIVLENIVVRAADSAPDGNETEIRARRIELAAPRLWSMLFDLNHLTGRLSVQGLEMTLDLRSALSPSASPASPPSKEDRETAARWLLRLLPPRIDFDAPEIKVLTDAGTARIAGLRAELSEGKIGEIAIGRGLLDFAPAKISIGPAHGKTAWKNGVLYLAGLELGNALTLRDAAIGIARPGGPSVNMEADAFGGWLRLDFAMEPTPKGPSMDVSAHGGGLSVGSALAWSGIPAPGPASGEIPELRMNFRGQPADFFGGVGTLWLRVRDFESDGMLLDSLALGCELAARTLQITRLELDQESNRISASAQIRVPDDGNWLQTSMRTEATAEIGDLGKLARLAGPALPEISGALSINARIESERGEPKGTLEATGKSLTLAGAPLGNLSCKADFLRTEVSLRNFSIESGANFLRAEGRVNVDEPFLYEGRISASASRIGEWLRPLLGDRADLDGALAVEWQGDGTRAAHSGGFTLRATDLRAPVFPEGINGEINATYSPENWYFSKFRFTNGRLALSANLSAGRAGVSAENLRIDSGKNLLLFGRLYLPFDPLPMLNGRPWTEGILAEKKIYSELRSKDWRLRDLAVLFGQDSPVNGRIRMDLFAEGSLDSPVLRAELGASDLRTTGKEEALLASAASFKLTAKDGIAMVTGSAKVPNIEPLTIEAAFPFGARVLDGALRLEDPTGPLQGKITLPGTNLATFASLFPELKGLSGTLAGGVTLGGSVVAPELLGELRVTDGAYQPGDGIPAITNLRLETVFDGPSFRIQNSGGEIGAGPFTLGGSGSFKNPGNPSIELLLKGERVLLFRSPDARLRANLDLALRGGAQGGAITGSVALDECRIHQRPELARLLQSLQTDTGAPLLLPDLSGKVPPPFGRWTLDVKISNANPFLVGGEPAGGSIEPSLSLLGTLGDPRPAGEIFLRDLVAFLPFSTVTIPGGRIFFLQSAPRNPVLDIRGSSEILEYDIQLSIEGPLDGKNLILHSDPPLSREAILTLLLTGVAPGNNPEAGSGGAARGRGEILILESIEQRDGCGFHVAEATARHRFR